MSPHTLVFLSLLAVVTALPPQLSVLFNNKRLYDRALQCLLNDTKCIPQLQKLKDDMLRFLKNGCEDCSEEMRTTAAQVIKYLQENKPDDLKLLQEKYDPERIFKKYAPIHGINQ